jgi:DNA-binding response OmpR family regulator
MEKPNPDTRGARVLLRDPDAVRRQNLARLLREAELNVVEAESSAAALACLEQDTVSLVLAYESSTYNDAFSLGSIISNRTAWDTPPVIVLLDREDAHVCNIPRHTGVADLIMLPCADDWLVARIRHHLMLAKSLFDARRSEIAHSYAERLAQIGSWEWNTDTNSMHWSDETFRVLGFEPGEVEMSHVVFWNSVHPEDRKMVLDHAGEALDIAHSYSVQHRVVLPDGSIKHVQQQGQLVSRRWSRRAVDCRNNSGHHTAASRPGKDSIPGELRQPYGLGKSPIARRMGM